MELKGLRKTRQELGMTMVDLAVRVGVSLPTITAWERGVSKPSPEHMRKLLQVLNEAAKERRG